jgi:hypothetical protein
MIGSAAAGESATAEAPTPLDLPSATTLRFVLLAAAMLVAGLFIGVSVFGAVYGRAFASAGDTCYGAGAAAGVAPIASLPDEASASACLLPFERLYAVFALGGAVVVAAGAVAVIFVAPYVLVRLHRLRDPGPAFAAVGVRLAAFCADAGIRRPPRVMAGSATLRDAFSFGRPGRYAIAVPLPLIVRAHTSLFEATLRHELAHVRSHDVAVAWLSRAVWYSLAPLLLVPALLFFLTGDEAILPGYLWRAVVIAVVVALAARSALRSRELSADVAAARLAGSSAVTDALARARSGAPTRWRRLRAVHPGSAERIRAVQEPGRTAVVTITDGLVVGLLVGLMLPTLDLFFTAVLFGTAGYGLSLEAATALLLGPLAGATLGLGFWRQAAVAAPASPWKLVAPVLAGSAVGAVLGQLASPGGIGLPGLGGLDHPVLLLVVAAALVGAAALSAGCAHHLADVVTRRTGVAATAVAIAICTTAIWAGDHIQGVLDQAGWTSFVLDVPTELTPPLAVVSCLLAGALALSGLIGHSAARKRAPGPAPGQILGAGLVAGLAALLINVGNGLWIAHTAEPSAAAQTFAGPWFPAAAAAAAAVLLALTYGLRGWGAGLIAGPIAAVVAAGGGVGVLALGGSTIPDAATATGVATGGLGCGFAMTLLAAAVLPTGGSPTRRRSTASITACAALLAAAAGLGVGALRDAHATPLAANPSRVTPTAALPTAARPTAAAPLATADYKIIVPFLAGQYTRIQAEMAALDARSTSTRDHAAQIDDHLVPDLQRLRDQATAIHPADPTAAGLHSRLIDALQRTITGYRIIAVGLTSSDAASLAAGRAELAAATQEFTTWADTARQL